jgi:hypothetical protein
MNRIWRTLRLQARLDMATGVVVAAALLVYLVGR